MLTAQALSIPIVSPPHTNMVWPVMNDASSDARKHIRLATSSGNPILFNGILLIIAFVFSLSLGLDKENSSVLIGPGPI